MGLLVDRQSSKRLFDQASKSAGMGATQANPNETLAEGDKDENKLVMQMMANINGLLVDNPDAYLSFIAEDQLLPRGIGIASAELIMSQLDAMEVAERGLPQEMLPDIARYVVNEVYDLSIAAGIAKPQGEDQMQKDQREAIVWATDHYMTSQEYAGKIEPGTQEGLGKGMQPIINSGMTVDQFNQSVDDDE